MTCDFCPRQATGVTNITTRPHPLGTTGRVESEGYYTCAVCAPQLHMLIADKKEDCAPAAPPIVYPNVKCAPFCERTTPHKQPNECSLP